jgi:hypothetical protein
MSEAVIRVSFNGLGQELGLRTQTWRWIDLDSKVIWWNESHPDRGKPQLIAWNIITLDRYFEGRDPWQLGMHGTFWGAELEEFDLHLDLQKLCPLALRKGAEMGTSNYSDKFSGDAMQQIRVHGWRSYIAGIVPVNALSSRAISLQPF